MTIRTWQRLTGFCIVWHAIMKDLVTNHPWDWYLNQAYETSMAMTNFAVGFGSLWTDGRRYLSPDSERPQDVKAGRNKPLTWKRKCEPHRPLEKGSLSLWQRNAVGLDGPGGSLCLDEVFRIRGQGAR